MMNIDGIEIDLFGDTHPTKMSAHLFHGAKCIDYKTAQRADTSKQNCSSCPRYWYIDAVITCRECRQDFTFSAAEQRYWYEDRKFWVDSFPKRCPSCGRLERLKLELRKRYDASIEAALTSQCSADEKGAVIAIIDEMNAAEGSIPEKMKQNRAMLLAQLKKLNPDAS
jgi:hypothetical protein